MKHQTIYMYRASGRNVQIFLLLFMLLACYINILQIYFHSQDADEGILNAAEGNQAQKQFQLQAQDISNIAAGFTGGFDALNGFGAFGGGGLFGGGNGLFGRR